MNRDNDWSDDHGVLDTCPDCGGRVHSSEMDGRCDHCAGIEPPQSTRLDFLQGQARIFRVALQKRPRYEAIYRDCLLAVEREIAKVQALERGH